jgi:hypothetical protein
MRSGSPVRPSTILRYAMAGLVALSLMSLAPLRAQATSAASPDQQFLENMADLNQDVALLAHETLHRAGTFPSKADAENVDKRHDDEMDHMRAALKMLNDSYHSKASHADSVTAAVLGKESGATFDKDFRADVVKIDQRELQLINTDMPQLTNAQVKTLAERMGNSARAEAKALGGGN